MPIWNSVLNRFLIVKELVGAFNKEKVQVGAFDGYFDISRSPVESSSVDSRYDLDIVPAEAGGEERQHALVAAAELQEVLAPLALVLVIQNSAEIVPNLSIRVL